MRSNTRTASWWQSQPLPPFASLNSVVSDKAEWSKFFCRSCEWRLCFTEASKPPSEVYLKQKVPWNWIQTNYYCDHIFKKNLVTSELNLWPTDVLCFCVRLARLKSEAAHVLGNRRATSHMKVQTTDPPPEAATFCKNISVFSRSRAEMPLLLSSTQPSYLPNSTKPVPLSDSSHALYNVK